MQRLFVDTSAWFAYAKRMDRGHATVRKAIADFDGRLVTSNFIFDETLSLCLYRLGHAAAERIGTVLLDPDAIDLIRVTPEDEQFAWTLFRHRSDQRGPELQIECVLPDSWPAPVRFHLYSSANIEV